MKQNTQIDMRNAKALIRIRLFALFTSSTLDSNVIAFHNR